jgi:hypothetical protein
LKLLWFDMRDGCGGFGEVAVVVTAEKWGVRLEGSKWSGVWFFWVLLLLWVYFGKSEHIALFIVSLLMID